MQLSIPNIKVKTVVVPIAGVTPLITHNWDPNVKEQLVSEQSGGAKKQKRSARDPKAEYEATKYHLPDGRLGFPARAFKSAMVRAAKGSGTTMTDARKAFFVKGEGDEQLVPIVGDDYSRCDMVVVGRAATPRFRSCFEDWMAELVVEYDAEVISPAEIVNLANRAGFGVGVGDWRPEKNGDFGRFQVITE